LFVGQNLQGGIMSENKNSAESKIVMLVLSLLIIGGVIIGAGVYLQNRWPQNAVYNGQVYVRETSDTTLHTVEVGSRKPYVVSTTLHQKNDSDHAVIAVDTLCIQTTDAKHGVDNIPKYTYSEPRPATAEEIQIWNTSPH
jgi:hypothetical protein